MAFNLTTKDSTSRQDQDKERISCTLLLLLADSVRGFTQHIRESSC